MNFVIIIIIVWVRITGAKGEYSTAVAFGIAGLSLVIILLGPVRPLTYGYANKLFGFARSNAICHVLQRPTFEDSLCK